MTRWSWVCAVVLAGCTSGGGMGPGPDAGPVRSLGDVQSGRATYYGATGEGACSYDATPNDLMVAAMDQSQWNGSAECGECVLVTGPSGSVTVRIVDLCPGCESGHLDLSQQAFAMIADPSLGNVPITWQPFSCAVTGPIAYRFKEGSSQYWVAIQVRNARLPIQSVEAQVQGAWMSLSRQDYNYFVASSGLGPGPYTLRVTASDGQQLMDTGIALSVGNVVAGTQQFQ